VARGGHGPLWPQWGSATAYMCTKWKAILFSGS
jgi:hypothetical protein